jgi:glutamate--cysteine ligase
VSQTLPTKAGELDDPGEPIGSMAELVEHFRLGEKPRERFRIGTEHEKFGFVRSNHAPLPFDGPSGIESILNAITENPLLWEGGESWKPIQESGRTIALYSEDGAAITLEPGGQIELSGAPLETVHQTCEEVNRHLALLRRVSIPRDVGFIGMGFHPTARGEDMPSVPKNRYAVMEPYLRKRGSRGVDMMKRTGTVQANLDYESEADMVASFRTALAISPVVAAFFVNSPFKEGKPSGVLSERLLCWADTDPDRCGYPAVVFEKGFGYERWMEWVLDVPMFFVRRDGIHHDVAGASFRQFLAHGLDGHRATLRDFQDHLTTVFTEVRLKQYLEVRGADCGPWSRICALPALWKGILYDRAARESAWALMEQPSALELDHLQLDVARHGFNARYRGQPVLDLARRLADISSGGLEHIGARNARNEDERRFLQPLRRALDERLTFAEMLLKLYHEKWNGSLEPLWEEIEFWPDNE